MFAIIYIVQVKMAVQYMRRVIQRRAKFDIMDLDVVQVCFLNYHLSVSMEIKANIGVCLITSSVSLFFNSLPPRHLFLHYLDMHQMTCLFSPITRTVFIRHMR